MTTYNSLYKCCFTTISDDCDYDWQVKGIMCDADDLSHLLTSYREQLKASAAFSSLPDVMQQQLAQFMVMMSVSSVLNVKRLKCCTSSSAG